MKTYKELVRRYRRRSRHDAVDAACAGLTYADELAAEAGLLIESDPAAAVLDAAGMVLPFVTIAASEGYKVISGRKPAAVGLWDGVDRMTKTAVAIGLGSAAAAAMGLGAAIPAAMGVRLLLDRCHLRAMTGRRIQLRTERLRALNDMIAQRSYAHVESAVPKRISAEIVEV